MNIYSCEVRLCSKDSSLALTVVAKQNLTAPEIMVLRKIHGVEQIANIVQTGRNKSIDLGDEFDRLRAQYPKMVEHAGSKALLVDVMFPNGADGLPQSVVGARMADVQSMVDEDGEAKEVTSKEKAPNTTPAPPSATSRFGGKRAVA